MAVLFAETRREVLKALFESDKSLNAFELEAATGCYAVDVAVAIALLLFTGCVEGNRKVTAHSFLRDEVKFWLTPKGENKALEYSGVSLSATKEQQNV